MAKVFEKVLESLKTLADERKVEIHSQAEVTRYESLSVIPIASLKPPVDLPRALKSSPSVWWL